MIRNDAELQTTQERIVRFQEILAQLRITATPEKFPAVSSGYRSELEKMQKEVLDNRGRHSQEAVTVDAAS